jgi:ABC-type oligopeptide transport system substrate-binding subunit
MDKKSQKSLKIVLYVSLLSTLSLFLSACGEETKETHNNTTVKNPVNTYLDSRVDALDLAQDSVKKSNKRTEAQDKALEALTK